jgi:hypothetical protein
VTSLKIISWLCFKVHFAIYTWLSLISLDILLTDPNLELEIQNSVIIIAVKWSPFPRAYKVLSIILKSLCPSLNEWRDDNCGWAIAPQLSYSHSFLASHCTQPKYYTPISINSLIPAPKLLSKKVCNQTFLPCFMQHSPATITLKTVSLIYVFFQNIFLIFS